MRQKESGIYKIVSPIGKIYIGQTSDFKNRIMFYKNLHCKGQIKVYESLIKYGYENHKIELIEKVEKENLNERERFYQEYYDCLGVNGLNLYMTGTIDKKAIVHKETRQKMSKNLINNKRALGLVHTQETKDKIRERHIGNKYNLGYKHNEFSRFKMSLSRKGKQKTIEHRKAIGIGQTGKDGIFILNIQTGIYYNSIRSAADSICMKRGTLHAMIHGRNNNKTNFVKI